MTQLFHINSKGLAGPCKATKGNCPFGGAERHYPSEEAAQAAAYREHIGEFGMLSNVNTPTSTEQNEKDARNSELRQLETTKERTDRARLMFLKNELVPEIIKINNRIESSEEAMHCFQEANVGPYSADVIEHFQDKNHKFIDPVEEIENEYERGAIDEEDIEFFRTGASQLKEINSDISKLRDKLNKKVEKYIDFELLKDKCEIEETVNNFRENVLGRKAIYEAYWDKNLRT